MTSQAETPTKKKASLVEVLVGSNAWTYAIQERILDGSSLCFVCGDEITFRKHFFYMIGRGVVMLHADCFSPPVAEKPSRHVVQRTWSDDDWGKLPPGDWMKLKDAAKLIGISYTAMYQRLWQGAVGRQGFEKHFGQWFVLRETVLAMGYGKKSQGRPPGMSKARMWRSDVTEPVERISSSEAARMIGVSRSWVLSRKQRFDAIKVENMWHLSKKMVEDYINSEEVYGVADSLS